MLKKLAINFSSLSLLQISNYIFPLITFPYLVRILGPVNYGLANFALAFLVYFNTIIDFGFNFSATRNIAQSNSKREKINTIFNLTFYSKIFILIPISIIYFAIIFFIPFFEENFLVYLVVFFILIGNALFPVWFFQGIEKMYYITFFNVCFRTLAVILIFLLVTHSNDVLVYLIINSGAILLTGIAGILFIVLRNLADLKFPGLISIKIHLKKSFDLFTSQFLIMLYTTSNTFVLGLISGNAAVGFLTGADKIRNAVQNIGGMAGQTIFPHLSNLFEKSKVEAVDFLKKYLFRVGILTFLSSLIIFLFANEIVLFVLGEKYIESILLLKLISFLPSIIFLSNVFGVQFMLGQGYDRFFKRIIFVGAVVNIILLMILIPEYEAIGTVVSMLVTESLITILTIGFYLKKK